VKPPVSRCRKWLTPRHVRWQKVAGELDAMEIESQGACQGMRQGGLADAGDILDQQVTARQQAGDSETNRPLLAQHDTIDLAQSLKNDVVHGVKDNRSDRNRQPLSSAVRRRRLR
jgi:hypothetical protein